MSEMKWQPIETTPKNKRILLYRPTAALSWTKVVVGKFDDDRYTKNPRPYWKHDLERLSGTAEARGANPTHWMLLPVPPIDQQAGKGVRHG